LNEREKMTIAIIILHILLFEYLVYNGDSAVLGSNAKIPNEVGKILCIILIIIALGRAIYYWSGRKIVYPQMTINIHRSALGK